MRRKIRCFAYGKCSDVQRQQPDVKSRRTAEESRTMVKCDSSTYHVDVDVDIDQHVGF